MNEYKIRLATINDIPQLIKLVQLWVEKDSQERFKMLSYNLSQPDYHIMIAEINEKIIGFWAFQILKQWINTEKQLYFRGLFIHPEHRQKGVMKLIFNEIIKYDFDLAKVETILNFPLHLGFEKGNGIIWCYRKNPKNTVKFIREKEDLKCDKK